MVDPVFGIFEVIEAVLTSSLNRLPESRPAPRQRLARDLIELFDLLGEIGKRASGAGGLIQRCETAQTREGKVYLLFEAGKVLQSLGEAGGRLLYWAYPIGSRPRALQLAAFLDPDLERRVAAIIDDDSQYPLEESGGPYPFAFERIRGSLQAVAHPDPGKLPSPELLSQVRQRLESLAARCSEARSGLRAFAGAELSSTDFFADV